MDDFLIDSLSVLLGAIVSLVSVLSTQFFAMVRESYGRRASVRDQAYLKTVDAVAEFIGISHLYLSRAHDLIGSLYRIKQKDPTLEHPGGKLDMEFVANVFMSTDERLLAAETRAEAFVTDDEALRLVKEMQSCKRDVSRLIQQGNDGSLPSEWRQQLDHLIDKHDQASRNLIDYVRRLGAKTTYRSALSLASAGEGRDDTRG